jgi:hypothetical protein
VVQELAQQAAAIWLRAVMAPEGLEVGGRARVGWYSSSFESGCSTKREAG